MEFRTAMKHYREGVSTQEEAQLVERELEKMRLLDEYMEDQWQPDIADIDPPPKEVQKVRKGLRKHRNQTALLCVLLVAAIIAAVLKIAVPVLEQQYWDPAHMTYASGFTDLELTMRTFSELFIPNRNVCEIQAAKNGFAAYDLSVTFREYRERERYTYQNTSLIQGELAIPEGMWEYPKKTNFCLDPSQQDGYIFERAEQVLRRLPEYIMVRAYVTFPEDLDMEGVMALFRRIGSSKLETPGIMNWIGIRVRKDQQDIMPLCGMKPFYSYDIDKLKNINQDYSCFSMFHLTEPVGSSVAISDHFKSILTYSMDQVKKQRGIIPESELAETYYQEVLAYVEEHGVYSYGCSLTATPQQLLELLEDGTAMAVSIEDAWIGLR